MARLLRDRYIAYDDIRGCDLVTGEQVRLDDLPDEDASSIEPALAPLIEAFDTGSDGRPTYATTSARNGSAAARLARAAAAHARRRGYVALAVDVYERLRERLTEDLRDRALLLIARPATEARATMAMARAAAESPRPHVLLTITCDSTALAPGIVREARTAYTVTAPAPAAVPMSADVARHIARGSRASEFERAGRHAAAERLLRDVSGALERRQAWTPAAQTFIRLARLLLERGRARAADGACEEAVRCADASGDLTTSAEARIWQALARAHDARLTDAESLCRVVLASGTQPQTQAVWCRAVFARVLLAQSRLEEAAHLDLSPVLSAEADAIIRATIGATAIRILMASGDTFKAGYGARALLQHIAGDPDVLAHAIASTAHLRVAAASGDVFAAGQCFGQALTLARRAHSPLRAARARLIWFDMLRRSGHDREAQIQLLHLKRVSKVAPRLLRHAIDERVSATSTSPIALTGAAPALSAASARSAATLVRLLHQEDSDRAAVRRAIDWIADRLHTSRTDLVSADAGPVTTIMTTGHGLATRLGARVLDAGIAIPHDTQQAGREIGVPVRQGPRLIAALVSRWPVQREPLPSSLELLELAAAVLAPRIDGLLAEGREAARASTSIPELVGVSGAMTALRAAIHRAAAAPFSVLLEGESGVGKELVARAIHQLGPRRERRFCDVNCAALPDDLLESELFGHCRGAFTGAVTDRAGLFEDANGGTLFLDELADLSPRGQAKLLRALQQQEVRRVGETFSRKVDVRLIAAANRGMHAEAAAGRFRQDLLYRVDVIRIAIPPLRERPEDVPVLAAHFWRTTAARVGTHAVLSHGVLAALAQYHWPGNIRELENVMAALAVSAPARGQAGPALLPSAITGATRVSSHRLHDARLQFERRFVESALARCGGHRMRAATELGLSRQGLMKTMMRLGLEPGRHDAGDADE